METKTEKILQHLKLGRPLTKITAIDLFGSITLAAIISVLRHRGHKIITEMHKSPSGSRYAVYRMEIKRSPFWDAWWDAWIEKWKIRREK